MTAYVIQIKDLADSFDFLLLFLLCINPMHYTLITLNREIGLPQSYKTAYMCLGNVDDTLSYIYLYNLQKKYICHRDGSVVQQEVNGMR